MKYQIIYKPPAERALERFDQRLKKRLLAKIELLGDNPFPPGSKKLSANERGIDLYRIRVGDYRVIYTLNSGEMIILVLKIAHRREIYR